MLWADSSSGSDGCLRRTPPRSAYVCRIALVLGQNIGNIPTPVRVRHVTRDKVKSSDRLTSLTQCRRKVPIGLFVCFGSSPVGWIKKKIDLFIHLADLMQDE